MLGLGQDRGILHLSKKMKNNPRPGQNLVLNIDLDQGIFWAGEKVNSTK